jgi:PAS domain S-box-containing protein
MRLKTKLVLGITAMVVALVVTFSYIYLSQLMRQHIAAAYDTAALLNRELQDAASDAQPDFSSTRVDTGNQDEVRVALAEALQTDANLNTFLDSIVANSPIIYDAAVADRDKKAILHTDPNLISQPLPDRPDFLELRDASFRRQLKLVFSGPRIYEVRLPLQLNSEPFGSTRIGVSNVLLKNEIQPHLRRAMVLSVVAVLIALFLAAALSNFALYPLTRISQRLDNLTAGRSEPLHDDANLHDEYGLVTLKIAHLGRQFRDVQEVFSALKDNLDQIMANLQDGLMLFTRDSRIVLVSASVERFVGRPRGEMLGRNVSEVFSDSTRLGRLILDSFRLRREVSQGEVEGENGKRMQVSLDFIHERGEQIGALLVIRDAESVRRIEDEIELSRRLSAIGRLTSGVAHEVKNPINAIVVHLEVLRQKLQQVDPDTKRHMDVIGNEIQRLDRVVETLVDFTRPVELRPVETDLRRLLEDVTLLASPEAERHGVNIVRELPADELPVSVDSDLIKQALLNVIINGVQAMPEGGTLTLAAARHDASAIVEIRDQGTGIPPEAQDKIFNLYFTTKKTGSGIGLPMTYRIMQLHHGTVEFESAERIGTTFRLIFPLLPSIAEPMPEVATEATNT